MSSQASGSSPTVQRLAAFAEVSGGGNPAGVSIGRELPTAAVMARVAAEVGYSETAFLAPLEARTYRVRYFSPVAEVPFCGHATIACGVALAQRDGDGRFDLHTNGGVVSVHTSRIGGRASATLTSLPARVEPASQALVAAALQTLRWKPAELDDALPPALAFAGAWHLILCVGRRGRLAALDYDFHALRALMLEHGLTTLQLVWRETADLFHVRDPFPVGGIFEDPATGAAAAAFGAYLRDRHGLRAPARVTLRQGEDMGRPSRLDVELVRNEPGVRVTGRDGDLSVLPCIAGEQRPHQLVVLMIWVRNSTKSVWITRPCAVKPDRVQSNLLQRTCGKAFWTWTGVEPTCRPWVSGRRATRRRSA